MPRHRKSPRSRRNLMVIDPLTPSQGHQFYGRLKLFSVSWSTAHPLWFDMPHDHVQKIKFLTPPQGPGGRDPKNCAGACAIHVSNSHTKSGWISEKIFFDPNPPRYPPPPPPPQVPPLGMIQGHKWKSRLICYISFICEKIHKVWFKNLWNWLCNSDLMIFDLLSPPQGPRRRGPKKWCRCMCHLCK